jgi:predicted helicase
MEEGFENLLPMGTRKTKAGTGTAIFKTYSRGVSTSRDAWAYSFQKEKLILNLKNTIEVYNDYVSRFGRLTIQCPVDTFVATEDSKISWSRDLKLDLSRGKCAEFSLNKLRRSLYRPFSKQYLFFDKIMNEEVYQIPQICPDIKSESENRIIILPDIGGRTEFWCLISAIIPNLHLITIDANQCFPFYTYAEDGTNRRENITDWSLAEFRTHYADNKITKWDIFHYIYAILHHPLYRSKFAANLRRSLPRIPYAPDFRGFANAGKKLADLHVKYEEQKEYKLEFIENPKSKLDWRVEKMRLSNDKTQIVYNDFLTLAGIPPEAFEYRLGNRSALDWIIDQYQVSTDKRSGIVNDPNNSDDPEYIVKLIGKVITVSLETVKIVKDLPELEAKAE